MDEVAPVNPTAHDSVGETLRAAREAQGLDMNDIAARTRVPLRHLASIEAGDYNALPSRTYATGFARAYARAVGVDEVALIRRVRDELAQTGPRAPEYQPYQAPDPARVPSRGLAIVTLGVALAVVLLAGLWFAGLLGGGANPAVVASSQDDAASAPAAAPAPATPAPAASPTVPTGGQVTLETTDRVWMRVHDGSKTLFIGTMSPGERFDVPADAENPLVDVGRPDKLKVTLNGSSLPPLAASSRPVTNLRVGAAAVAARLSGQVAPTASDTSAALAPTATPTASSPSTSRPAPSRATSPSRPAARSAPRRTAPLDETARANLEAARSGSATRSQR